MSNLAFSSRESECCRGGGFGFGRGITDLILLEALGGRGGCGGGCGFDNSLLWILLFCGGGRRGLF